MLNYLHDTLQDRDPEIYQTICDELNRQRNKIQLIASENIASEAVLAAKGSILTNKYAEGYPGRRYYGGCEFVDVAEELAISRVKQLFECEFANVQPHSGSQANQAVMLALLQPGDTILGMSLSSGGHLTHGSPVTLSGKWFNAVGYDVHPDSLLLDYDAIEEKAIQCKPKLIIAGGSSYPREIDFKRFREIADRVGAYLLVDMAHFSGLVAGKVLKSPLPYADIVTSTTHKTLRGPRGGIILSNNADLGKKINSAVFPGIQGGPLMDVIAAKAVAFGEALKQSFRDYSKQVILNAQAMCEVLIKNGLKVATGGTDMHLFLVDLRGFNQRDVDENISELTGNFVCEMLERASIVCNKNGMPFDNKPPSISSGLRFGTPFVTSRGFKEGECRQVAEFIADIIKSFADGTQGMAIQNVRGAAENLCKKFPIYPNH